MPPLSPQLPAMPSSPRIASTGSNSLERPAIGKRNSSSQSSMKNTRTSPASVGEQTPLRHAVAVKSRYAKVALPRANGSARNLVKMGKQAAQQQQQQLQYARAGTEDQGGQPRMHGRQRSHEGDTEIRLPGSLDEGRPPPPPIAPIRRNLTSNNLPRNASHSKLKKNLSHGQLSRLQSGSKNVNRGGGEGSVRAPSSPGLKGRTKKAKSADMEREVHEQEMELFRQQQDHREATLGKKKVGFAVGSAGTTSGDGEGEDDGVPGMEGSGLQEDEWTEESASASPYSTRQNTANNSRRTSMVADRQADSGVHGVHATAHPNVSFRIPETRQARKEDEVSQDQSRQVKVDGSTAQSADRAAPVDNEPSISPRSEPSLPVHAVPEERPLGQSRQPVDSQDSSKPPVEPLDSSKQPVLPQAPQRSPLHAAKDYSINPSTRKLLDQTHKLPAPALVSNVSAMDDMHSTHDGSPTTLSMRSSRSTITTNGDGHSHHDPDTQSEELVSRFIPTASHPSTSSGANTTLHTPAQRDSGIGGIHSNDFHAREEAAQTALQQRSHQRGAAFHVGSAPGPVSPVSTLSGSSGAATPALGRSRIELRMLHDKALADREAIAERQPLVPHHIYDRRNETLKSYLSLATLGSVGINNSNADSGGPSSFSSSTNYAYSTNNGVVPQPSLALGPEIFQGRFKAVNTELKVVQKFRDPLAESMARLKLCRATKPGQRASPPKVSHANRGSRSAVSLPASRAHAAGAGSGIGGGGGMLREGSKLSTSSSPPRSLGLDTSAAAAAAAAAKSVSPVKLNSGADLSGAVGGNVAGGDAAGSRPQSLHGTKSAVHFKTGMSSSEVLSPTKARRGVSFAGAEREIRGSEHGSDEMGPDAIARVLWGSVGA